MSVVIFALLSAVLVAVQFVFPGAPWFHHGSYAALLIAFIALQVSTVRRLARYKDRQLRAIALVVFGSAVVTLAGLASGLLAPDTQTAVRGPGETVPLTEPAGALQFPIDPSAAPVFRRDGHRDMIVDAGSRRFLPTFVFFTEPRVAASVRVTDAQGRHLTMTQPTNTSFLSPVLLFAQTTDIGGRRLPVDSFAVPAAHRSVKAVLFNADAIARMGTSTSRDPRPGVLFAVEDERARMLPGAIALARDGDSVLIGGLRLKAAIITFPAVVIAPVPNLPVSVLGMLLLIAGLVSMTLRAWRA
ncbi:MAG: hypothetical protein M3N19_02105 [Candidatus Eremiobacteraeota bacterium]|nr:hypothetical protein [Candidatus Eremiobacteraeota bacterium]